MVLIDRDKLIEELKITLSLLMSGPVLESNEKSTVKIVIETIIEMLQDLELLEKIEVKFLN